MKKLILTFIIFLFGPISIAQTDNLKNTTPAFTKMIVGTAKLYALDKDGHFHVWSLATLEKQHINKDTIVQFTAIAKNKSNEIFLGTNDGKIFSLNKNDYTIKFHLELRKNVTIREILFNSKDEIFLIVPSAIYDPIKEKYWNNFKHEKIGMITQKRFLFFFSKRVNRYFDMPQYTFIDSKDRIWMIKSFGEFGGSIQIFDTKKRKELKVDIDSLNFGLLSPKSVFEDDKQNIYITSGLQHFSKSGEVYQIKDDEASKIYDSKDFRDTTETNSLDDEVFVGPGAYNHIDSSLYFATTNGFYRSSIPSMRKFKNPELIFTPELIWEREPLAIGAVMTVKKLAFTTDNRLVFLTSNNGIGIFDGIILKMIY